MKKIFHFFKQRHEQHYAQSQIHLAFDLVLSVMVILLIAANVFLWLGGGKKFVETVIGRHAPLTITVPRPTEQTNNELLLEVRPMIEAFGQKIGLGPHPPQIGEESTYWIFVRISPQRDKLTNVAVRSALAHGVKWTGRVSAGSGSAPACEENCEFRWTIGDLEATSDNSLFSSLDAAFEVALTPTDTQTTYQLLRYIEVSGKDGE